MWATLQAWVNFRARLSHGAPEGSSRDADLAGMPEEQLPGAVGVLHVDGQLGPGGPRVTRFALPGINPNVASQFDDKTVAMVRLNTLLHLHFEPTRPPVRIAIKPDRGDVELGELSAWERDVLISYALGKKELPADPSKNHLFNRQQLLSLFDIHGPAKVQEGAEKIARAIGSQTIRGLESR